MKKTYLIDFDNEESNNPLFYHFSNFIIEIFSTFVDTAVTVY